MNEFAIIGGGIGGLTLAIALQRKGFRAKVYESAPAFKPLGAGLALASNAMRAYRNIGIDEQVIPAGKRMKHMYVKDAGGKVISHTDAEELTRRFGAIGNFTIHRADLHRVLSGLLEDRTVEFGKTLIDFSPGKEKVSMTFGDGSRTEASYLIAADGIHSVIRKKLLPASLPRYSGYTCWRAIVDDLPDGLNMEETSETWGPGRRFGVVPLNNDKVYWFATLNAKANDPRMKAFTVRDLQEAFKEFHFPVPQVLERTRDNQLIWGDIIDIKPIRKFAFGRVVLMGDAAHATTPNMGQGACMAIEDAATLVNALSGRSPEEAFRKYEEHRISRTTSIVNTSWNFGKLAQVESPLLMAARNGLLRLVPKRSIDKQMKFLFDVSFDPGRSE